MTSPQVQGTWGGSLQGGRCKLLSCRHPDILDLCSLVQELVSFTLLAGGPVTRQAVTYPGAFCVFLALYLRTNDDTINTYLLVQDGICRP